jgi:hypothetical protein
MRGKKQAPAGQPKPQNGREKPPSRVNKHLAEQIRKILGKHYASNIARDEWIAACEARGRHNCRRGWGRRDSESLNRWAISAH